MPTIAAQRIRLKPDPATKLFLNDILSSAAPSAYRGNNLNIEFGLYFNSTIQSVANLSTVTCEVKYETAKEAAAIMSKTLATVDLDDTTDNATFTAGTKQHGTFSFAASEVAPPMGGKTEKDFWLVIWALTTAGRKIILLAQKIKFMEPGGGTAPDDVQSLADTRQAWNTISATGYTLLLSDENKLLSFTAGSSITLTVPSSASVPLLTGAEIDVVQTGSGQITVTGSGASIVSLGAANKSSGQHGLMTLRKTTGSNQWLLTGNITT